MNGKDQIKHINLQYYVEKLIDERCENIAKGFELVEKEFELVSQKFESRDKALLLAQSDRLRESERRLQWWIAGMGVFVILIQMVVHFLGK